jgi:hypothetical protein
MSGLCSSGNVRGPVTRMCDQAAQMQVLYSNAGVVHAHMMQLTMLNVMRFQTAVWRSFL